MDRYSLLVGMLSACILPDHAKRIAASVAYIDDAESLMRYIATDLQWSGQQTLAFSRTYQLLIGEI